MILDDDGLHLHQSDIETWMQCPEQLRLKYIAGMGEESFTSDAAFVGTTTHAVIEHELTSGEPYASLKEAKQYGAYAFLDGFEEMVRLGTIYSRETFKTDKKALKALEPLVESWYKSYERDLLLSMPRSEYLVEFEFDDYFTVTSSGLKLYLAGRQDLILPGLNEVWDWKTSSSEYKQWEKQRWAVQPSTYLWAAHANGLILPNDDGVFTFKYKVLVRRQKPVEFQTVEVRRTIGSFTWLERLCQNIAVTVETVGFDVEWPLNDHSALCGPKWCSFWSQCRGLYIDSETWT